MTKKPDYITPSDEAQKARKQRNIAIGLALAAFVVFVFVITFLQISGNFAEYSR